MASSLVPIQGVRTISGKQAYASPEAAEWYLTWREWCLVKYGITPKLIQAAGGATSSANTHLDGWAFDERTWDMPRTSVDRLTKGAREAGAAQWYRTREQGFDPHTHKALDAAKWTRCQYQVTAWKAGYNGLGVAGRGGKDDGPRPSQFRTWREGIAWMKADIAAHRAAQQEDDMALTDDDIKKMAAVVVQELRSTPVTANGVTQGLINHLATGFVLEKAQSNLLQQIASKDVSIDAHEVAKAVAVDLLPALREVAAEAVRSELRDIEDDEVERIAVAVVDKFAERVAA